MSGSELAAAAVKAGYRSSSKNFVDVVWVVLDVLHYPAQVRTRAAWEGDVPPSAGSAAEHELASQLLALASAPLDWARYRDTSAEELAALIQAKVAQQPPPPPAEEPVLVLRLLDALKQLPNTRLQEQRRGKQRSPDAEPENGERPAS